MNTDTAHRPTTHDGKTDCCHADDGVREANGTSCAHSGPTSQIPGLSHGAAADGPEERTRGRRVGVLESDSVYVKLAKTGGQKDLLAHGGNKVESKSEETRANYQAPDWFGAGSNSQELPSPTGSDKAVRTPSSGAPFGGDNKSTWEREATREKKSGDAASGQMEKLSLTGEDKQDGSKFRKTTQKSADPVSMSKLLGFGYAKDGKESSN